MPAMTTPQSDSAMLTMVLEGLSRLEKGQESIQQELRLLRDSDQSIHARVSNMELVLTRQIEENRRISEVKDKEHEERLREQRMPWTPCGRNSSGGCMALARWQRARATWSARPSRAASARKRPVRGSAVYKCTLRHVRTALPEGERFCFGVAKTVD